MILNNKKIINKIKSILKIIGLKWIFYKFFYFIFKLILNNKSYFLKGIIFDVKKITNDFAITSNNYNEKFILFTKDEVISKEIFINNEFDLNKLQLTIDFLNSKNFNIKNLIDIGANIGAISIPAVNRNLVEKSYVVEPMPDNYKVLKANIILNNFEEKIKTYNYALSDSDDETVDMEISENNSGDHRVKKIVRFNTHGEEKRNLIKVKTKKFDTLFNDIKLKNSLIKIDTQGHEAIILSSANRIIENKIPTIIEFWPYGLKRNGSWERMFDLLKKFRTFIDLSNNKMILNEINSNNLNKLAQKWDEEKPNKGSLFTDLLLL